jgi:hypothetical protein
MQENGGANQNPHRGRRATVKPLLTMTPWPSDANTSAAAA